MITRKLWDSSVIPALGLGCWAIGGKWSAGDTPLGWGAVDDAESIRAVHAAVDNGIQFFDTAQAYGLGHSERVLGTALKGFNNVKISTKVGITIDETAKQLIGPDASPVQIEKSLAGSLQRLQRDHIDVIHLHLNSLSIVDAEPVFERLELLRKRGTIGAYGWSTDYPDRAAAFAGRVGFVSIQHAMNVFFRADALVPVIEENGLLSINRSPLAMGLLSGKYDGNSTLQAGDVRSQNMEWMSYFKDGRARPDYLKRLDAVQELLKSDGRSLVQGAIAWLWGRSKATLPIPGFRSVKQVEELTGALEYGPLTSSVMNEIERVIVREPEGEPRDR